MVIYPVRLFVLKTELTRTEVDEALRSVTHLSDKGYRNESAQKKIFWGIVSPDEFELEVLNSNLNLVPFVIGSIKGVKRELYVYASFRAFKHRRIYALFLAFFVVCVSVIAYELIKYGPGIFQMPWFIILLALTAILSGYLFIICRKFEQKLSNTLAFLSELIKAKKVSKNEVPLIFRQ